MPGAPTVLLVIAAVVLPLTSARVWAQDARAAPVEEVREAPAFHLEQNYPNPVDPETWIPFFLEESLFEDGDPGSVSIRIVNVLRQLVAVPVAVDHPSGKSPPVQELIYVKPGRKLAYWNGRDTSGRRVPSGVYYCQLVVDGKTQIRKLIVLNSRRKSRFFPWFD